jgi:hypothetical protein
VKLGYFASRRQTVARVFPNIQSKHILVHNKPGIGILLPPPTELLSNPDFTASIAGWTPFNCTAAWVAGVARLTATGGLVQFWSDITVPTTEILAISMNARVATGTSAWSWQLENPIGTGAGGSSGNSSSSTFTTLSRSLAASAGTARLIFYGSNPVIGDIYEIDFASMKVEAPL